MSIETPIDYTPTPGTVYKDIWAGRHPSVQHFKPLFEYGHLPLGLQWIPAEVSDLVESMLDELPDGPELSAGLRRLLEAKDCFVRARVLALNAGKS